MASVLALDPGTTHTAWVVWDGRIKDHGRDENADLVAMLRGDPWPCDRLAVEMIASYGMPVGAEVFQTCVWIGRFVEAWSPRQWRYVYRRDVKLTLCGSARAKDPNVRQALLDRVGPQGSKKAPGPTYGISGDVWAALGVAVVAVDPRAMSEADLAARGVVA